jgi:hypothetical protein
MIAASWVRPSFGLSNGAATVSGAAASMAGGASGGAGTEAHAATASPAKSANGESVFIEILTHRWSKGPLLLHLALANAPW